MCYIFPLITKYRYGILAINTYTISVVDVDIKSVGSY